LKEDSPPTALDLSTLETRVSNYTFDFQVTEHFIAFFLMPLVIDEEQMRRGGDGSDMRWVKGPTRGNFHVMGGFDDGQRLYMDLCLSGGQLLPFMPHRDGTSFDPAFIPGLRNARVSGHHRAQPTRVPHGTAGPACRHIAAAGRSRPHHALSLRVPALPWSGR